MSHVFASLLHKLRLRSARLRQALQNLHDKNREKNIKPTADDLGNCLKGTNADSSSTRETTETPERFLLIFDAIDEASDKTRAQLSSWLNKLNESTFRILITSREYVLDLTSEYLTIDGSVEADLDEMFHFIAYELRELIRDQRPNSKLLKNGKDAKAVIMGIRDRAQGM